MKAQRILVIEDDPDVQRMLRVLLDLEGHSVTALDSALGAMAAVRRLQPDVILLDLALPYRSGAWLLAELKADASTATVPVLVVSANTHILSPDRQALAAEVITKPFDAVDLLKAVGTACTLPTTPRPHAA
jgi:CheY-like chemotaxis protein